MKFGATKEPALSKSRGADLVNMLITKSLIKNVGYISKFAKLRLLLNITMSNANNIS
jgi:hypothetical protein